MFIECFLYYRYNNLKSLTNIISCKLSDNPLRLLVGCLPYAGEAETPNLTVRKHQRQVQNQIAKFLKSNLYCLQKYRMVPVSY